MTTRSNAFFGGLIEGKQEENVPHQRCTNANKCIFVLHTTIYRKFKCDVIHAPLKPLSTPRLVAMNNYNKYSKLKSDISIFKTILEHRDSNGFPEHLSVNLIRGCHCIHVRQLMLPERVTHPLIYIYISYPYPSSISACISGEPSNTLERYWNACCYCQQWLHSATAQDLFPSKWNRARSNSSEFSI